MKYKNAPSPVGVLCHKNRNSAGFHTAGVCNAPHKLVTCFEISILVYVASIGFSSIKMAIAATTSGRTAVYPNKVRGLTTSNKILLK